MHILLNYGANVNFKNTEGETPLHFAALRCNLVILKELIDNGGDIFIKDSDGFSVIESAGNVETLKFLLEYRSPYFPRDRLNLKLVVL